MNWAMPCAPFGLTACGLKRLSFQISRTNGIGGKPSRFGLLLHDRADDVDERLGPSEGEARLLDASLDQRGHALARLARRAGKEKRQSK